MSQQTHVLPDSKAIADFLDAVATLNQWKEYPEGKKEARAHIADHNTFISRLICIEYER